jgi:hypothetical protein
VPRYLILRFRGAMLEQPEQLARPAQHRLYLAHPAVPEQPALLGHLERIQLFPVLLVRPGQPEVRADQANRLGR